MTTSNFPIITLLQSLVTNKAVLLPIPTREKAPRFTKWQQTTLAKMANPAYLAQIEEGNIGVLLGAASDNLCAIDIDEDSELESFFELNPQLKNTLRTKGSRGEQIWVRISGSYPELKTLTTATGGKWGEWRANGGQSVIYGVHPKGMNYQFANQAPAITLAFEDIQWPAHLSLPWKQDESGDGDCLAYDAGANGAIRLNEQYWVTNYMAHREIIFHQGLREFFEYDSLSGIWRRVTEETIKRQFMRDLQEQAKKEDLESMGFKLNDRVLSSLVALLRTMAESPDVFANRPQAIHVKNGMLVFEGKLLVLKSFAPEYYSRNFCPYNYDENADCPRFKNDLLGVALDADDIRLMQKWAGLCVLGRNIPQRLLLVMGAPNGGKSTFMNILESIIGGENVVQLRTEHLSGRFELYRFIGKTLLAGKDVPADFLLHKSAQTIKALIGHDTLSVEKKGGCEPMSILGDFNMGITCNSTLNVWLEGDAGAWRRRLMVVIYERAAGKRVPDFAKLLLAEEGSGILRWMVEGAIAALADIAAYGDLQLTPKQLQRVEDILAQSDSVRHFVEKCVVRDKGQSVTSTELKAAYLRFCEESGWIPLSAGEVARQLPNVLLEIHHCRSRNDMGANSSQRGYSGIGIKREDEDAWEV